MDTPTIQMDPAEARKKLRAYRQRRRLLADEEYATAAKAYAALAEGTPLIDMHEVLEHVPYDDHLRPAVALARADRKEVYVELRDGRITFDARLRAGWGQATRGLVLTFPSGHPDRRYSPRAGFSLVPMIPPEKVPKTGTFRDWFILWEVETWSDHSLRGTPDRDPLLLRRITSSLFAVLAEWDLTDLERRIMAGRTIRS